MKHAVGPVLENGDVARGIVAAIRSLNEAVEVHDRGAYVRVLVPRRCVVTREAIERVLGRTFRLPADLEIVMPSFRGRLDIDDAGATWEER